MYLTSYEIKKLIDALKDDYPSLYTLLMLFYNVVIGTAPDKNVVIEKNALTTIHVFLGAIPFYLNKVHNNEDYMLLGTLQEVQSLPENLFNELKKMKTKEEREQYCISFLYNIVHGRTIDMYDELTNPLSEFNLRHASKSAAMSKENANKLITSRFHHVMIEVFDNYNAYYDNVVPAENIPATNEQDKLASKLAMLRAIEETYIAGKAFPQRRPLVQRAHKEFYPFYASFYELADNIKANIWAYLLGVLETHNLTAEATAIKKAIKSDPNYLIPDETYAAIETNLLAKANANKDLITSVEVNTFIKFVPILKNVQSIIDDTDKQFEDIKDLINDQKEPFIKQSLFKLINVIVDTQNTLISGKAHTLEIGYDNKVLSKKGSFLIKEDPIKLDAKRQVLSSKLHEMTLSLSEEPGTNLLWKIKQIQLQAIQTMGNVTAKSSSILNMFVNKEQLKNNINFSRQISIFVSQLECDITTLDDSERKNRTELTCQAISKIYQDVHNRKWYQRIFDSQGKILASNLKEIFDSIVNLADIIQDEPLKQAILETIPNKDNKYQLKVSPIA